ncbi:MAG: TetR/AcrR family transcriptional regulator [Bacteroidetes bacterium]|nr:TetR/AcrR family transcriptional regulator [Bacteroidota bacterium]
MLKVEMARDERMKSSIIEAARELFQQYGLSKTTMEDIARSIGKGKSSLYYYYPTKEDLFEAVMLNEKQGIFNETIEEIEKAQSAESKLRSFALAINKALKKRRLLFEIIRSEPNDELCLLRVFKQRYDTVELDMFRSIISYGIETGEFRQMDKEQLEHVTLISVSMLRGLRFNLIVQEQNDKDISKLINFSIDLLIRALK